MRLNRTLILTSALVCILGMSATAQNTNAIESYRTGTFRYTVTGQGIYNGYPYPGNIGVSLDAKVLMNSHHVNADAFNEYTITLKGIHTFATDGPLYGSFDKGYFNNVSSVLALVGYRFNFGVPPSVHGDYKRDTGGWFLELNAGGAYYRFAKKLRPAVSPMFGYALTRNLDVVASYTGTWNRKKGKYPLAAFGLGVQYSF